MPGSPAHTAGRTPIPSPSGPGCRSNTSWVPTAAGNTTSAASAAGPIAESVMTTTAKPALRASRIASSDSRG